MLNDDKPRIYSIPDNFIDESRIINGMFRTRYFIEGIIMAAAIAIPALLIPAKTFNTKIMIVVGFATPFFLLGNNGFNGDPISITLKNWNNWRKERRVMLYNTGTKALKKSPLDDMMEQTPAGDKILDLVDAYREKRRERAAELQYIEGETFEFAPDSDLKGLYADDVAPVLEEATELAFVVPERPAATPTPSPKAKEKNAPSFCPTEIEIGIPEGMDSSVFGTTEPPKKRAEAHPEIKIDLGSSKFDEGRLF